MASTRIVTTLAGSTFGASTRQYVIGGVWWIEAKHHPYIDNWLAHVHAVIDAPHFANAADVEGYIIGHLLFKHGIDPENSDIKVHVQSVIRSDKSYNNLLRYTAKTPCTQGACTPQLRDERATAFPPYFRAIRTFGTFRARGKLVEYAKREQSIWRLRQRHQMRPITSLTSTTQRTGKTVGRTRKPVEHDPSQTSMRLE
jgi:hypothetical protein